MIEEYNGSVFDAETEVIAHQVNCKGVMGSGLAGGDWAFNYRAICLIFNNLYKECTVKICKI